MRAFETDVAVRWSDMDAFGHVNNARVVTLLEEARTELLFTAGARRGAGTLRAGVIVVELAVRYRLPLVYTAEPVRARLWVSDLRAASFTLEYVLSAPEDGPPAVTASTLLAPYAVDSAAPRRLLPAERDFLECFRSGSLGDKDGGDDG